MIGEWTAEVVGRMHLAGITGKQLAEECGITNSYRKFEPGNKWDTVETTIDFLMKIADNCDRFPTAIIEVSC